MNNKLFSIVVAGLAVLGSACERPIDIELEGVDPLLVVEGWITTDPGPYSIHLSYTGDVFDTAAPPLAQGAFLTLTDDLGEIDTLIETSPGWYQTQDIQGRINGVYSLGITIQGKQYTATDFLPRINQIDTCLAYWQDSSYILGEGWYPVMVAQEAPGKGDFYLFRFYLNDSLYDSPGDYWLTDDRFADGQLAIFQFPYQMEPGDTGVIEIRSLSEESYDYYYTFLQSQFGNGSPFSSPPNNLQGNISNGGMGYFGGYGVVRDTLVVPL